jgi:hypothetical protein
LNMNIGATNPSLVREFCENSLSNIYWSEATLIHPTKRAPTSFPQRHPQKGVPPCTLGPGIFKHLGVNHNTSSY